jgi:glutaredoxin
MRYTFPIFMMGTRMKTWIGFAVLVLACTFSAQAGTVYKSVGPDGRIVYSDQPPVDSKVEKTLDFANLPVSPLPPSVLRYREELQKSVQKRLADPGNKADSTQTVLFSAEWCGYCRKAKAYLAEKGIRYREYDVDTPEGSRALAELGEGKGIPVLVRNGRRTQGFSRAAYDAVFSGQ